MPINKKIIPTGWEQIKLGDIGKVSMCKRIFKHETLAKGSVPFYKISTFGKIADSFISKEIFEEYKRKYPYPKKGEILISASGTIGRTVVFNGEESYFQDSNIVWISNPQNKVLNDFLKYVYFKTKWKSTDGGIISRLYNEDVRSIKFLLPPLPEQQKIVEVLETWDACLEKLTKIIKSKKRKKKYLMQQLLSGKLRLNNFSGEWEYIRLSNLAKTSSGGTPKSTNEEYYQNGTIPWLKSGELRKGLISKFKNYITEEGLKNSSAKLFPINTILIAMYGVTAGQIGFLQEEASTNQAICGILPNSKYDSTYLYYFFLTQTDKLLKMGSGAAQPNISQEIIKDYEVFIPKFLPEQTAIAQILTTADQEIEALEKKHGLIEDQKKFLLNNLVTGEIRLPEFIK